jgi:hypothetical protein
MQHISEVYTLSICFESAQISPHPLPRQVCFVYVLG